MTENTCYSHVSFKSKIKIGSVGQALPLCEVKLSEKKEILIKHDALMDGYYKDETETNKTIIDGWLQTGDEGEIDVSGFLTITGRVKDIFKTSKGKYVSPNLIEMKLDTHPRNRFQINQRRSSCIGIRLHLFKETRVFVL